MFWMVKRPLGKADLCFWQALNDSLLLSMGGTCPGGTGWFPGEREKRRRCIQTKPTSKMDREESKSSLSLCREPRLIVYFAYANELTSFQCHVTSC